MDAPPKFLNPHEQIERHGDRLPHWQQDGTTYFLTFHLADSLPKEKLDQLHAEREAWLKWNPQPWSPKQETEYHERFSGQTERWLDEMHGSCALRDPDVAGIVAHVLQNFDGVRYRLHAFVVMPNHVHTLASLNEGAKLEETIQSWKGVSARHINEHLGRAGKLWQKDYFDRMVRDTRHFWNCARYIRRNPEKAQLRSGFILSESETVKPGLDERMRL